MPIDNPGLYIGLMSGTSVDGIDAALIEIDEAAITLVDTHSGNYPPACKALIKSLMLDGSEKELQSLMSLDVELGITFAETANHLIEKAGIKNSEVQAIGSHGQTIRHYPLLASTLQIADPNVISQRTGISVIADFRRADMALGGQGAPLMPAFHQAVFSNQDKNRAVINIGGIANITTLNGDNISGYDTGPGNTLMDAWYTKHKDGKYDDQGHWATTGGVNKSLLDQLLSDPWFEKQAPKSTGQDYFNLDWLATTHPELSRLAPCDVQATLLALTAQSIATCVDPSGADEAYICGGGAHNQALMNLLNELIDGGVSSTATIGMDPDWIEAAGFAWLAWCFLNGRAGNVPAVTGASRQCVLGGRWG
jgi:anhydro-N-acetylmuramic acid kinase